jgi:hypothetical protein
MKMAKNRAKRASFTKRQRNVAKKRSASGKEAALTKTLDTAKRSAAAKWAWVTRQQHTR